MTVTTAWAARRRRAPSVTELAFELLRRVHGHGCATEAAPAVVSRAADLGHRRLRASVRVWNLASRRVLARSGSRSPARSSPMRFTATARCCCSPSTTTATRTADNEHYVITYR
ncbi:GNAT family N-acetyltransferase [Serinibacter arcticus]|uniref:GNAT family N-acetyltransferase n=1 Tax=Serinibacter arcticus TaxID=1655435 RepID=UPI001F34B0A4|nr:GNAT family N-acetyltransferase [Serinibacter arcticus]